MSRAFTGTDNPLPCHVLREAAKRGDICYACFDGVFCNEDKSLCQDLSGCSVDGAQRCSFFQSCQEVPSLSISTNSQSQVVTRCRTDALRVTIFVLGCILVLALVFMLTMVVRDHVTGKATRFADGPAEARKRAVPAQAVQ